MRNAFRVLCALSFFTTAVAYADEVVVSQKNRAFAPGQVSVPRGKEVTFRNDDTVAHNVFSKDAKFNLKIQAPGSEAAMTFNEPGTYEVRCAIHPKMILKVHVTP